MSWLGKETSGLTLGRPHSCRGHRGCDQSGVRGYSHASVSRAAARFHGAVGRETAALGAAGSLPGRRGRSGRPAVSGLAAFPFVLGHPLASGSRWRGRAGAGFVGECPCATIVGNRGELSGESRLYRYQREQFYAANRETHHEHRRRPGRQHGTRRFLERNPGAQVIAYKHILVDCLTHHSEAIFPFLSVKEAIMFSMSAAGSATRP